MTEVVALLVCIACYAFTLSGVASYRQRRIEVADAELLAAIAEVNAICGAARDISTEDFEVRR